MDRAYMLDDYVKEQDENLVAKEDASDNLDKLEFRIQGSKTIEELKKEVSIFLEKNDVPSEIKDRLEKICSEFNENTNVYQASLYLEEFMKKHLEEKKKIHQESSDTVLEIKEELVHDLKKDLDAVGITVQGSNDSLIDSIESEADVYRLKDNVERTTNYLEERQENLLEANKTLIELPSEEITKVLENPTDETLLNNVLEQEEKNSTTMDPQVEVKEDGSIVVQGNAENRESMNFAAMMTTALVTSNNDFDVNQKMDMKFIKNPNQESSYKIIYGNFPLPTHPNDEVDPILRTQVAGLVNNYQPQVSYLELLGTKSPELMTAFSLIQEQILKEKGAFQMAIKNGGNHHEMIFAMDENYINVSTAFHESGAMVTNDAMEHSIIRVNDTTPGEQLLILNTTLENLRQKEQETSLVNQNAYQKQLTYPESRWEAANVHRIFLIVVLVTEILLLLVGSYFFFA